MANPDASQDGSFMEFLEFAAPNPFPTFMLEMIRSSWEGTTIRAALEANMSSNHELMTEHANEVITISRVMPDYYHEDSIFTWMGKVPSLRNSYALIEYLLARKNYTQAETILNGLTSEYRFNTLDGIEYGAYTTLYNFKKELLQNNIEINQLNSTKIEQLKAIADVSEIAFPCIMARSALCFFYQICYPEPDHELPEMPSNRIQAPLKTTIEEHKDIIAYPNPAKDHVAFYFNLTDKNEVKDLVIADIIGKPIYRASLKGSIGQHIWNTIQVKNGQYIYSISTASGQKYSGKITIEK